MLTVLVGQGRLQRDEAHAWADVAGLDGRRHTKRVVADALGRSVRSLDLCLQRVDQVLEQSLVQSSSPRPRGPGTRSAEQLLFLSAIARLHGRTDEADGIYSAAADLEALPAAVRRRPDGRNRTKRLRARTTAPTVAARRWRHLRLDSLPAYHASAPLTVIPYTLQSDPQLAVNELRRAHEAGDVASYPLLLDHAVDLVPNAHAAGAALRLDLLEIGCNMLRDAESLLAIGWCRAWMELVRRMYGPRDIRIIAARRTLAHVLQLHGFLSSAAAHLNQAIRDLSKADAEPTHASHELADLLLRRSSVEVARSEAADLQRAVSWVKRGLEYASPVLRQAVHPALLRNQLQLASMYESRMRLRRSPGVAHHSTGYERALLDLMELSATATGSARYSIWDTVIGSATRVGDLATVHHAVDAVLRLDPVGAHANIQARIRLRLLWAATDLRQLSTLRDIQVLIPDNPHACQN